MFHANAVHNMITYTAESSFNHDKWRPFMKELVGGILTEAGNDPHRLIIRLSTSKGTYDLKPWEVYYELMHHTYVPVREGDTISVVVGYEQDDGSISPDLKVAYYYQDE